MQRYAGKMIGFHTSALALLVAALPLVLAVPAQAASFDCAKASSPVENAVCADAGLSALDEALAKAFSDALSVEPNRQSLLNEQRKWIADRRKEVPKTDDLRNIYQTRLKELQDKAAFDRSVGKDHDPAELAKTCLFIPSDVSVTACTISESGAIAGAPGPALSYQLQTYAGDGYSDGVGVVIVAATGDGHVRPILWSGTDGDFFSTPAVISQPTGPLLDLPGNVDGTGNFNAESLYQWKEGRWSEIDTSSWVDTLKLPKGLAVLKGVYPDWGKMTAFSPLWKDDDSNASPTGGSVSATLALKGDKIVVTGAKVSRKPVDE